MLALSSSSFSWKGMAQSELRFIEIFPPGTIFRNSSTAAACAFSTLIVQLAACPCTHDHDGIPFKIQTTLCQDKCAAKNMHSCGSYRVMDCWRIDAQSAVTSTITHETKVCRLIEGGPILNLVAKSMEHGYGVISEDRYNGFTVDSSKLILQSLQSIPIVVIAQHVSR